MQQYLALGRDILENGNIRGDRTGTGTVSVFGRQFRFNLASGFPLLTTKKMFLKAIIHELLWFLQGDTNNNTLNAAGVGIWDEWALDYSVDFPMFSKEFADLLGKQFPEKLEAYLEYEKQHTEHNQNPDAPLLKLWEVQQWAMENNIPATKKKPILTLDDRIHWMLGMCDPVISKQINYEYCLNGVHKRDDNNVITKLDGLGVPPITPTHGDLGPVYGKQWRSWKGKVISAESYPEAGIVNIERESFDQISELIHNLKNKPFSRRHVISAWNVEDLPDETISPQENVKNGKMALAPCHCLFQFYVREIPIHLRGSFVNVDTTFFDDTNLSSAAMHRKLDAINAPKYFLDCQLYQRSH